MIGHTGPNFTTMAIMPDGSVERQFVFEDFARDRMTVLFFFSMAFSYICPTELLALAAIGKAFKQRNVALAAVSCDSHLSLQNWLEQPLEQGGLGGKLPFPLISDPSRKIAEAYDILVNDTLALRATFIMDKQRVIRSQMLNDFHMGRNTTEIIRLIDAHQHHEETGRLCPANWDVTKPSLSASRDELNEYLVKYIAQLKRAA